MTVFYLYRNVVELVPFPGYKQFSLIYQVPAVEWRADMLTEQSMELNRWIIVYVAFVFFAIFGFTQESRNNYRATLHFVDQVFVKITSRTALEIKLMGVLRRCFFCSLSDIH